MNLKIEPSWMSSLRRSLAAGLCAALVWTAPGLPAYQAFGQNVARPAAVEIPVPEAPLPQTAAPLPDDITLNAENFVPEISGQADILTLAPALQTNSSVRLLSSADFKKSPNLKSAIGDLLTASPQIFKILPPQSPAARFLNNVLLSVSATNRALASPPSSEKIQAPGRSLFDLSGPGLPSGVASASMDFPYLTAIRTGTLDPRGRAANRVGRFSSGRPPQVSLKAFQIIPPEARLLSLAAARRAAVSASSRHPAATLWAAAAALAVGSLFFPHLRTLIWILPVICTCYSMQERAARDATILPNETGRLQQKAAQEELDKLLVAFGKQVQEAADQAPEVTSDVSAHKAEHAAENPILEKLQEWSRLWSQGEELDTKQALQDLRSAILAELKRTTLPHETPEQIEAILKTTGFWDQFQEWEKKYSILDSLKQYAQKDLSPDRKKVQVPIARGGEKSNLASLLPILLLLSGPPAVLSVFSFYHFLYYLIGFVCLAGAALSMFFAKSTPADPEPIPPPVPLDAYLQSLGLSAEETAFLKEYTLDIGTKDIAPVIGRSKELKRVVTILSKPPGTQNNPMLLGDKGVGKTAIVEAVAKLLYENRLPSLRGKRILELDSGKLVAGTQLQGEMEQRLTKLRTILAKTNNKVVLFVDEIHSLLKNVGIANAVPDLLKSPLRDGRMTVIGGTTVGEFRQYVEKDPAFADRFDVVMVEEPSIPEAVEMLEGIQEYLERIFGVGLEPGVAEAAVKLSARYVPEKFLPRKARVLLEMAISEVKPQAAKDAIQIQMDQLADRLRLYLKRYAALKNRQALAPVPPQLRAKEVDLHNRIVALYQSIASLQDKQKSIQPRKITKEDVLKTLAQETGIPLGDLGEDEYQKLLKMEPWFREKVVGQEEAISALADTIRRNKAGLSDPNRPQGAFFFLGPTGVGKTELAKTLAEFLFNNKDSLIRLDMSEYMEKFSVQRLFGAPPGYVGYDQGGELTEKARRRPYSVILLDEIEKAHPDVLNALLQVLEDGRMTDGKGNTVDFKNTVLIMTSNAGTGTSDPLEALRRLFRPEFLNRIDKIVLFNSLKMEQAEEIVSLRLKEVEQRLGDQDIKLNVSPQAVRHLAQTGFDPLYGARPLKRAVEQKIASPLANYLIRQKLEGAFVNGGIVDIGLDQDSITFNLRPNPPPIVELAPLPEGPLGEKLKKILEEALKPGSQMTEDMKNFEAVLFPEKAALKLDEPMGAFRPNASFKDIRGRRANVALNAPAGTKDSELKKTREEIESQLAGRWQDPASPSALKAWLEAFSRWIKELAPDQKASLEYWILSPDAEGTATFALGLPSALNFSQEQSLARAARDHFSVPMNTEQDMIERAARLKDEGRPVDRDLLNVKRLVEAVPGATFGYFSQRDNKWKFWLQVPIKAVPKKEEPNPPPESSQPPLFTPPADAAPEPEPPPEPPVTVLDARSSPSNMFRFLTQNTPRQTRPLRDLVAGLLEADSSQLRLLGLELSGVLLPAEAFYEVAAMNRLLSLSTIVDHAFFSDLAQQNPGLPLALQSKSILDIFARLMQGQDLSSGRSMDYRFSDILFYADLARRIRLKGQNPNADLLKVFERNQSYLSRSARRIAYYISSLVLGTAGLAYLLSHTSHYIISGIPGAIILLFVYWGGYENIWNNPFQWVSRLRRSVPSLNLILSPHLNPDQRARIALDWLEKAQKGKIQEGLSPEQAQPFFEEAKNDVRDADKAVLFSFWRKALERASKKAQNRSSKRKDVGDLFGSLGVLGYLHPWVPPELRNEFTDRILEPLKNAWLPRYSSQYQQYQTAVAAWLRDSDLSPAQAEDIFNLVARAFPTSSSQNDPFRGWGSVLESLSLKASLSTDLRTAFDQFVRAVGAVSQNDNWDTQVRILIIRARLGYVGEAWAGLKALLESLKSQNRSVNAGQAVLLFQAMDDLIREFPPSAEDAAWLRNWIPNAQNWPSADASTRNAWLALIQTQIQPNGGSEENLKILLKAAQELPIQTNASPPPPYRELLREVRSAAAKILRTQDAKNQGVWEDAVKRNLSNLKNSYD